MSPIALTPPGNPPTPFAKTGADTVAAGSSTPPSRRHEVEASRALEQVVGPAALAHPAATAATKQVLARVLAVLSWAYPKTPIDLPKLLGAALPEGRRAALGVAVQLGDVAPQDVMAALETGGPQTWISMIRRTEGVLAPLLHQLAVRAEASPAFAARLQNELGMAPQLLIERRWAVVDDDGDDDPMAFFCPPPSSPVADISAMRRRPAPHEATHGRLWSDAALTPAPGDLARRYLQRVGASLLAAGAPVASRVGVDGQLAYELPEALGTLRFRAQSAHPWHQEARRHGMHTAVSISGTTYRLLWMARLLGGNDEAHIHGFTLALLGHMVPRHHAYHEVMSAAAEHGFPYAPGLAGMRAMARRLAVDERPRAASTTLLDLPDALIERIVARGRSADLPHILLATRALSQAALRQNDLPSGRDQVLRRLRASAGRDQVLSLLHSPWASRLLSGIDHLPLARRGLAARDLTTLAGLLSHVKSLSLDGNALGDPEPGLPRWPRAFAPQPSMRELTALSLRDVGMAEVPEALAGLPRLAHLVLDDNALGSLPSWLGELAALRTLSAASANLSRVDVAGARGLAPRLEELNLAYNPELSTWPLVPGAGLKLRRLSLYGTSVLVAPRSQWPAGLAQTNPLDEMA